MGGIVSGIAKIGGNIIAGNKKKKASKKAQAAQEAAQIQVRENTTANQATNNALFQPYADVGKIGLDAITKAYASGDPSSIILAGDPGYDFRRAEGAKSISRATNARGGAYSGAQLKALDEYDQNFASNEYGKAYDRTMGLVELGSGATTAQANVNSNATGTINASLLGTGQAQATGALERGAISAATWQNSINDGIQAVQNAAASATPAGAAMTSLASIFKKKAA